MKKLFNSLFFKKAMVAMMLSQPYVSNLPVSTIRDFVNLLNDKNETN